MNHNTINDIEAALLQMADARQASIAQRFFKTSPGEYGEGDCFLGIPNPKVRLVVKEAWKQTTLADAAALAKSRWHEARLCALLIMVAHFENAYRRNDLAAMRQIVDIYLSLHPYINNWDLVDLSAYKIIGRYELLHPDFTLMDVWIAPGHTLWQRRIAMVATWWHAHNGLYDKLLTRAEALLPSGHDLLNKAPSGHDLLNKAASGHDLLNKAASGHDLLNKAAGWMLREMYKHDAAGKDALEDFLTKHIQQMPSIMLSYALEKMSPSQRHQWRQLRNLLPSPC